MKTFITVLILSVIHAASALATEAKSVSIHSHVQQTGFEPLPDTTNKQVLLKKVREQGWVRVIITYDVMEFDPPTNEAQRNILAQEIETYHSRIINEINAKNLNVSGINKSRYAPRVSLSANDEETVKKLYGLSGIKNIREARFFWRNMVQSPKIF